MDATATFLDIPIVPVLVIEDEQIAVPLAETLLQAGITAMEITLRSSSALGAIESVAQRVPQMLVGAGSIQRAEQVKQVADAGGQFLVSPGCTVNILTAVEAVALPFVPGAVTASEILALAEAGYHLTKFFPAELAGGVAKLKALSDPMPEARFFATGGITAELLPQYLTLPAVSSIGGTWFVPRAKLVERDLAGIGELAKDAMTLANQSV